MKVTLLRLRKLLRHEGAVTLADGRLGLDDTLCSVDVDVLDSLLTRIENISHEPSAVHADTEHLATHLMDLYRGAFLAGEREQHWMLPLRDRLRGRLITAVETLGGRLEHAGEQSRAIVLYRHALDQDNLAEPIYRRLMLAHLTLGEKAEALSVYRRCKDMLSILLGAFPSAETQAAAQTAR
jgi:DNA-binding SARP family transcriptional activator